MVPQIIFMLVALLLMNGADMGPGRAYTAVFLLVLAQFSEGFVGSGVWTKSLDISKRYSTLAHGFMNGLGCAARPRPAELSPRVLAGILMQLKHLLHAMSVFSTRSHPPVSPPAYHEGLRRTGMLLSMHCLAR